MQGNKQPIANWIVYCNHIYICNHMYIFNFKSEEWIVFSVHEVYADDEFSAGMAG